MKKPQSEMHGFGLTINFDLGYGISLGFEEIFLFFSDTLGYGHLSILYYDS